jgi:hypothetical protein
MTHSVEIYSADTAIGTIGLSSSGVMLEKYVQNTPEIDSRTFDPGAQADGGEVYETTYRNVTESVQVMLIGATTTAIRDKLRSIETALGQAHRRSRGVAVSPIYLRVQMSTDAAKWQSEILAGRAILNEDSWQQLPVLSVKVTIILTRRFYWEASSLTYLSISNSSGSDTGSGITISNRNDASGENWVDVDGADVVGTLPVGTQIEFKNNTGSNAAYRNIYISCNQFSTPASFNPVVEAENSEAGYGTVDSTDATNKHGGASLKKTLGGSTYETLGRWALSPTVLGRANGNHFMLLAVFNAYPASGSYGYVSIGYPHPTPSWWFWTTSEVDIYQGAISQIIELGTVQLPPGLVNKGSGVAELSMGFFARGANGQTVDLDFIAMMPLDGYRRLKPLTGSLQTDGTQIIDTSIDREVYVADAYVNRLAGIAGLGQQIVLVPGKDARFHFWWDHLGIHQPAKTANIRVGIRERRLTI